MRLTHWNGQKWILPQGRTSDGESFWRIIAERLAAYEETGLEPDEIGTMEALKKQADALGYKLVKKSDYSCMCCGEYPRTERCAKTHEFVRKSRTGNYTYCRKKAEGLELPVEG